MTPQSISGRWVRGGLAMAALFIVLLAILLLPRVTRGQDGSEGQGVDQGQGAADFGQESLNSPADLNSSPYVVGAGAFVPDGYKDGQYLNRGWDGFLDRSDETYGYICFVAPVHLPDGATIDSFDIYAVDNDGNYVRSRLLQKKYNYGAGGSDQAPIEIGYISTNDSAASPNIVKNTDSSVNVVVDNGTYHYYIESCPWSPAHQVYSYRVNWSK